ncbi:MAG: hypothetical protein EOP18_12460, partial [Rhizobiaceae bacterium]
NPRLLDENSDVISFPGKGLLAAGYIASRPTRSVTRTELAAFLWGEDASNPLVALRQLLARVKVRQQEIGKTVLEISETEVAVPRDAVDCDFLLLNTLSTNHPLKIVELSLASITGGFFAGIGISSDRAELWLAAQQEQALSRFAAAIEALSVPGDHQGHLSLARQAAYRLLEFDPYNEIAYRTLIDALTTEGNFALANAMFERYRTRLQKDLDAAPDGGMLERRDQIARQALKRLPAVPIGGAPLQPAVRSKTALPRLMLMPPSQGEAGEIGILAGSLVEDVTINLCRAKSTLLVAPHTARRIAAMNDVARHDAFGSYGVSYVLETQLGSTATGADALFVSLVDIAEDRVVWADR